MKIRIHGLTIRPAVAAVSFFVLAFSLVGGITTAHADARSQAKRIHDRLTGVPPTDAVLTQMENMITNDAVQGPIDAANLAMDPTRNPRAKYFYNVVLKNWITPWTNVDQTQFAPLNDYTATVIGMIRYDRPFNQVLSANYLYTADINAINRDYPGVTIPGYSISNNSQYEALENNNIDLSTHLVETQQTALNIPGASAGDSAGVITSRAAGEAFISAGTNRRMLRFTLKNFMCRDLEDVKDITRVPDRIRQDVTRSPGGDSSLFLNSCIGCHSGMDPLASAYSYYEWTAAADGSNGHLVYSGGGTNPATQAKYHINRTNFETGFITSNDTWKNYWRAGPNAALEWDWDASANTTGQGKGAKQLGQEIAASKAFAQCQVEKVYKQVCLQSPIQSHAAQLSQITDDFKTNGYNLKQVFAEVANVCKGN